MEIKIKTLTPIWTGGINCTCDRMHETGIIGSLRWWYEALVRCLGGYACDPRKHTCDGENHCPVCELFGCTGWGRKFRLELKGGKRVYDQKGPRDLINIRPSGRNRGWYYGAGLTSLPENPISLTIKVMKGDTLTVLSQLEVVLVLIRKWTALGAKTQHGYGVVDILNTDGQPIDIEESDLEILPTGSNNQHTLPNLKQFFFAKIMLKPQSKDWWKSVDGLSSLKDDHRVREWIQSGSVPIAPAIKNQFRFNNSILPSIKRHKQKFLLLDHLLGTVRYDPRRSSKINISSAYIPTGVKDYWEIRVWGYVSDDDRFKLIGAENIKRELKEAIDRDSVLWDYIFGGSKLNLGIQWIEQKKDETGIDFLRRILL